MTRKRRRIIPLGARRAIRRLAGLLPSPRDQALIVWLRSGLDFIRGRPPAYGQPSVVGLPEPDEETTTDGDHGGPSESVRLGWLLVDAHERLGVARSRDVFRHHLGAWLAYARETITDLEAWPIELAAYQSNNNRMRFRRTLDFVRPEDRVFDVGFGRGYLCGLLFRDARIAAYHGIDVVPGYLESIQRMLEANGLEDREVQVEIGDLYELTLDRVAQSDPTLMICCEVLEHVPDPERGLAALAAALPENVDLLFSVPLYGRLESVWGHVTVFDSARLQAMIDQAGLIAHHVEPLANQWTLVVASKEPSPSPRVLLAPSLPVASLTRPLVTRHDFVEVAPGAISSESSSGTICTLGPGGDGRIECQVKASAGSERTGPPTGGVTFRVSSLSCIKLEWSLDDFDQVRKVHVDVHSNYRQVGGWTWLPTLAETNGQVVRRLALRPGESAGGFEAGEFDHTGRIDRVSLMVELSAGESASFSVKAAYLPKGPGRDV